MTLLNHLCGMCRRHVVVPVEPTSTIIIACPVLLFRPVHLQLRYLLVMIANALLCMKVLYLALHVERQVASNQRGPLHLHTS
jgi:hypothetical protein